MDRYRYNIDIEGRWDEKSITTTIITMSARNMIANKISINSTPANTVSSIPSPSATHH